MKAVLIRSGIALLVVYLLGVAGLAMAMRQPPEAFGRVMSKMPAAAYLFLPFETLWARARSGNLRIGDRAPDFTLQTLDKDASAQLSSFRGKQPVVLVFGSYT